MLKSGASKRHANNNGANKTGANKKGAKYSGAYKSVSTSCLHTPVKYQTYCHIQNYLVFLMFRTASKNSA